MDSLEFLEQTNNQLNFRKIYFKELPREIGNWIDVIIATMCESIYSTTIFKFSDLIYDFGVFQENGRTCKIKNAFCFLLNELQILLSSIEVNYIPTLIPNEEFPDFRAHRNNNDREIKK